MYAIERQHIFTPHLNSVSAALCGETGKRVIASVYLLRRNVLLSRNLL